MAASVKTSRSPLTGALLLVGLCGAISASGEWRSLPALPDREGFAAPFAGVSHDTLLVAGGANFPGKKPWEGGRKIWYDTVFALDHPQGEWRSAGRLPRPLGYGVSATHRGGVVCVGGSDAERHYAGSFRLEWKAGRLVTRPLPPLPRPVANACGALVGDHLYVAGGLGSSDARETLRTLFRLDLAARQPEWRELEPWPGPGRMLSVAASHAGSFWLIGGVDLVTRNGQVERRYLRDAYRYQPGSGWTRVADLPYTVAAAPSPAPSDQDGFYLLGGDDGSRVGFTPPERHPGFVPGILRFHRKSGEWKPAGVLPAPRVTLPAVRWREGWVLPSGEVRPGIRSPEVWQWTGPPAGRKR